MWFYYTATEKPCSKSIFHEQMNIISYSFSPKILTVFGSVLRSMCRMANTSAYACARARALSLVSVAVAARDVSRSRLLSALFKVPQLLVSYSHVQ
jgi:hypothetical protein